MHLESYLVILGKQQNVRIVESMKLYLAEIDKSVKVICCNTDYNP